MKDIGPVITYREHCHVFFNLHRVIVIEMMLVMVVLIMMILMNLFDNDSVDVDDGVDVNDSGC